MSFLLNSMQLFIIRLRCLYLYLVLFFFVLLILNSFKCPLAVRTIIQPLPLKLVGVTPVEHREAVHGEGLLLAYRKENGALTCSGLVGRSRITTTSNPSGGKRSNAIGKRVATNSLVYGYDTRSICNHNRAYG